MKRWRYLTLTARPVNLNGGDIFVQSIDGDKDAPVTKKSTSIFVGDERVLLWDYLNMAGEEGWEVISLTPITEGTTVMPLTFLIVLKQPTDN
jgi:hypothetical protein